MVTVNAAWPDSSLPQSQVRDRRSAAGRVVIFAARAAETAAAVRLPGGRARIRQNREDRSARVAIALSPFLPMTRSPSVRLSEAREGRVWLRSPCVLDAYWECPPGSSWGALTAD